MHWSVLGSQTLKKCLIIRAPCPECRLGSQEFTHLWRASAQNVRRSCNFRGCTLLGLPPRKGHGKCVQTALGVSQEMLLRCKQTSEGAQGNTPADTTQGSLSRGTQLQIVILHIQSQSCSQFRNKTLFITTNSLINNYFENPCNNHPHEKSG